MIDLLCSVRIVPVELWAAERGAAYHYNLDYVGFWNPSNSLLLKLQHESVSLCILHDVFQWFLIIKQLYYSSVREADQ